MRKTLLLGTFLAWTGIAHATATATDDMVAAARTSMQQGHFRDAEIQLKNALKKNPADAAARYELGSLDLDMSNYPGAEAETRRAIAAGYDKVAATAQLVRIYLASTRYKELLTEFDGPASDPSTPKGLRAVMHAGRAIALSLTERKAQAEQALQDAKAADAGSVHPWLAEEEIARNAGDLKRATAAVDKADAIAPNNIEVLSRLGRDKEMTGDLDGARAAYDAVMKLSPANATARLGIIGLTIRADQFDVAQKLVTDYLAMSPEDQRGIYFDAIIAAKKEDWKRANADLLRSPGVVAALPTGYLLTAIVKDSLNQPDQALEAIRKYAARRPADDEIAGYVARYAEKAGHPEEARRAIEDAVRSGNAGPQTLNVAAALAMASGRTKEAVDLFQQALKKDPTNVRTLDHLADAQIAMGDTTAAVSTLGRSASIEPSQEDTQVKLIYALSATGKTDDARKATDAYAARKDPNAERAALLYATIFADEKKIPEAKKVITEYLAKKPDSPLLLNALIRLRIGTGEDEAAQADMQSLLKLQPKNQDVAIALSQGLNAAKKPADAQAVLDRSAAAAQQAPQNVVVLASVAMQQERPKEALAMLDKATEPTKGAPGAAALSAALLTLRSQAAQKLDDMPGATSAARRALAANPTDPSVRLRLVALLVADKAMDAAKKVMKEGVDSRPHDRTLIEADVKLHEFDGKPAALAEVDRLIKEGVHSPEASIVKAEVLDTSDKHDEATAIYDDLLKNSPSKQVVMMASSSASAAGQVERAIKILHAWTSINPQDLEALRAEANMTLRIGDYAGARRMYQAVAKERPDDAPTLNNMAWAEMHLGDMAAATSSARKAFEAAPGPQTADTYAWMQVRSLKAGEKPSDEVLSLLERASKQMTNAPGVQYHYGAALIRVGRRQEGREAIERGLAMKVTFDGVEDAKGLLSAK